MDNPAQPTSLPPIIPPAEDSVPPPPLPPPPPTLPSPPGQENRKVEEPPPSPPKKKWGKGVLIGGVTALIVLVVGLGFGIWQIKNNQDIKKPLAACPGSDYCSGGSNQTFCKYNDQWSHDCVGGCWTNEHLVAAGACGGGGGGGDDNRHYITFTCTRCATDRRCQTPNIGENPSYSVGNAPGACAQVDSCELPGDSNCTVVSLCAESCSGTPPPSPPTPTPTPTPTLTSTPVPVVQCQQLKIFRNGVEITTAQIQQGNAIIFRGFASATNTTISKLKFTLTKGGVAQTPVDITATLAGGQYQADYQVMIDQAVSYSVTVVPISP